MESMEDWAPQYDDDIDALIDLESKYNEIEKSNIVLPESTLHAGKRCVSQTEGNISEIEEFHLVSKKQRVGEIPKDSDIELASKPALFPEEEFHLVSKKQGVDEMPKDSDVELASKPALSPEVTHPRRTYEYKPNLVPLCITKYDGSRVYVNFNNSEEEEEIHISSFSKSSSGLLSTPISKLKEEVFLRRERMSTLTHDESSKSKDSFPINSELWVEKYRPHSFIELLSDEGVNRILLSWLKMWDKIVFGKEVKNREKKKFDTLNIKTTIQKFKKSRVELSEDLDEHGRPLQKVVLLFGPPGIGKTTLAHVIAHHAGYNVVELNASDDRSPDVFRKNLEAATQMKAVLDDEKRPNCLVIDEIDGAPAPSINVLVSFIQSTGFSKGKRKKGEIPILMRPIICICNDQYVPALKSLRQIALILNFPRTSKNRLASRLHLLSQKEGLKADLSSLLFLCEKADNDIRSCLSTLQFLHNAKKTISLDDLMRMEIGQKDLHQSLFSVWQDIFYAKKSNEKKAKSQFFSQNSALQDNDSVVKSRVLKILKMVQTFGDYEKLFQGMFQNYLNAKLKTGCLKTLCKGPEWLCFADIIQSEIYHNQLFLLMPYLSYVPVAFNLLFASSVTQQLSFPSSYYDCIAKRNQVTNILSSIVNEVVASVKGFCDTNCLILDLLPALSEIIKPNLRPVDIHLYSDREKKDLRGVVEVMIAFNLNHRQERLFDGKYNYVLEPNIEEVVSFSSINSRKTSSYAVKQLIAREVSVEKMRRSETRAITQSVKDLKKPVTSAKSTKLPKSVNEKPNLDFFGRKIEEVEEVDVDKDEEQFSDIWYHFKEGHSNAVRRTVYVKDLL